MMSPIRGTIACFKYGQRHPVPCVRVVPCVIDANQQRHHVRLQCDQIRFDSCEQMLRFVAADAAVPEREINIRVLRAQKLGGVIGIASTKIQRIFADAVGIRNAVTLKQQLTGFHVHSSSRSELRKWFQAAASVCGHK